MVMLNLRFDLRNPAFAGVSSGERIRAALDMAEWIDSRHGVAVTISEHHGADDGYLPSPLTFAAAIAARTSNVAIMVAALIAPFYDPLRLAEDIAVVDNLSGGRLTVVLAGGYAPHEFEMFGVPPSERGRRTEATVETLRRAWSGESFDHDGRSVRVTPTPDRTGGPPIILGGSSRAAARRAARVADGYIPTGPESWDDYRDAMIELGKADPGPNMIPPMVTTYVATDPESAWQELTPYFLHETNAYGEMMASGGIDGPYATMTAADLRASGDYRILTPAEFADELGDMGELALAMLHPMVGGIPPVRAWEMLELVEREVLQKL